MKQALTIIQILIRLSGIIMLVLGVLFWTRNALNLIGLHMMLGLALVVLLWVLAALAARAGVSWRLVGLAIIWGIIVPVLGMTQNGLLIGPYHWVIQVLHLLVGLGAMGLAENLANRAKQAYQTASSGTSASLTT